MAQAISPSRLTDKLKRLVVVGTTIVMVGCASKLIGNHVGADQVALAEPAQTAPCKAIGSVTVSVLATVGFVSRGVDAVESNLLQMAKNDAVDLDGDTVVRGLSKEFGSRNFDIFKCRQ